MLALTPVLRPQNFAIHFSGLGLQAKRPKAQTVRTSQRVGPAVIASNQGLKQCLNLWSFKRDHRF